VGKKTVWLRGGPLPRKNFFRGRWSLATCNFLCKRGDTGRKRKRIWRVRNSLMVKESREASKRTKKALIPFLEKRGGWLIRERKL